MSELFMPYDVFFETTYGILLKYKIKSKADEEKLRHSKMDWRTNGAQSAPLHSGGLDQPNGAKAAPIALPNGARLNSVDLADPPLRSIWRSSEGEKVKLKVELSRLYELISEMANVMANYDRVLEPYWRAKDKAEEAIRRTHGKVRHQPDYGKTDYVIVYDPQGIGARKPLFADLTALAVAWGPTKAERTAVQSRMKSYEREAGKIETELKYLAKKGKKREQA
jgi:hypothetical protein